MIFWKWGRASICGGSQMVRIAMNWGTDAQFWGWVSVAGAVHIYRIYSLRQQFLTFISVDLHWITTGSRGPLSHFYDLNLETVHNKQVHKLRNILFNSQTKKCTKIGILILRGRLNNLIFNLQFQIPSFTERFKIFNFRFCFFTYMYFINLLGKII
jgi:hypothetical protein